MAAHFAGAPEHENGGPRPRVASIDEPRPPGPGPRSPVRNKFRRRVLHRADVEIRDAERASRSGVFSTLLHPFETPCPHLWRAMWNSINPLQSTTFSGVRPEA